MRRTIVVTIGVLLAVAGCGRESLLEEMQQMVPLHEGASVIEAKDVPEEAESIIQFDIEASQSSEDDIIQFYRSTMMDKGWEFEEIKRWPGNGSVFSMTDEDRGTLTIQTITKQIKQTGKIRVVLNLRRE